MHETRSIRRSSNLLSSIGWYKVLRIRPIESWNSTALFIDSDKEMQKYSNHTYHVGYHTDVNVGRTKMISQCNVHLRKSGGLLSDQDNLYLHDCTTSGFASGSGIFVKKDPNDPWDFAFVGLHVSHIYNPGTKDGDPYSVYNNSGVAVRFSGQFLKRFLAIYNDGS